MSELGIVPEALTETVPDPQPELTDLGQISELIAGDGSKPVPDASGEADEPVEAAAPEPETETPVDEPEPDVEPEIDYDQAVPMPDGAESVTVGQLKDHYREKASFDEQRDSWEATRMTQDNQMIAAKQKLYDLANLLGEVKPEALQFVQQQTQLNRKEQQERLLQAIPEWSDPAVKKTAATELAELVAEVGITQAEFAATNDYRHLKILHDYNRLRKKEAAGLAKLENIKAELPKGQKPVNRKLSAKQELRNKVQRAKDGSEDDKMSAIGALINGA